MGILNELGDASAWRAFYACKRERGHLSAREDAALLGFIERRGYASVTDRILEDGYCFAPPVRREINRTGSAKKRVVYSFSETENYVLKLIAFSLYRYDGLFADNCYAFRRSVGAKTAVRRMMGAPGVADMAGRKIDIRDYFNSIDPARLLPKLSCALSDDPALYAFLCRLLTADKCIWEGALIDEKRGAMAGTPISPFLANLYLAELDAWFAGQNALYARYSDDILFFAPDAQTLERYTAYLYQTLKEEGLALNKEKAQYIEPGMRWSFLGVEYREGEVGLSRVTKDKLKGKLRRKARALYRWKLRKGAENERALRAYSRAVNKLLYDNPDDNALTWARWFFPLLTTDVDLKELDAYMRACMRFIVTGRHNRANYRVDYETLKRCGCRCLVHDYYRFRAGGEISE